MHQTQFPISTPLNDFGRIKIHLKNSYFEGGILDSKAFFMFKLLRSCRKFHIKKPC
jgi:hypothetical protein